ncbi:MAG TPA: pitrilysin family protein [Steroidobacteraceae bacterium]|nr:pitrilysin family protein [Steroidobacteraceae bacterium]
MRTLSSHATIGVLAIAVLAAACAGAPTAPVEQKSEPAPAQTAFEVPYEYYRLDNGLRVVLSQNTSVPTATVGVYYNIGLRIEPRGRTGFAHLFEHMMFQGSENLGKMEFVRLIQSNGGVLNGSTRFDYTNYYQVVPSNTLETILWAEADRMSGLAITQENLTNQQGVVKNEVKVNVLNQPYGGFPWLDLPQYANENWYNAHNFYGDLEDLDAATLADVRTFFENYYAPGNAVLVVVGDFDREQTKRWIEQYFGPIAARDTPPHPDISEPRQTEEKRATRVDPLAPRPGLAIGYHVPPRGTPEHFAFGLIDQILLQGDDSWLNQELVKKRGYTSSVSGGINLLGNMFNYSGPMLWTAYLIHDPVHESDAILADFDAVIARLKEEPLTQAEIDRALIKMRSGLYSVVRSSTRFGLTDLLASYALFDDDPGAINRIEAGFRAVTPELIMQTAREYLRPSNRTILELKPGQAEATAREAAR